MSALDSNLFQLDRQWQARFLSALQFLCYQTSFNNVSLWARWQEEQNFSFLISSEEADKVANHVRKLAVLSGHDYVCLPASEVFDSVHQAGFSDSAYCHFFCASGACNLALMVVTESVELLDHTRDCCQNTIAQCTWLFEQLPGEENTANESVHVQLGLYSQISHMVATGGWEFSLASQRLMWTDEVCRLLGLYNDHATSLYKILRVFDGSARRQLIGRLRAALYEGKGFKLDIPVCSHADTLRWVRLCCKTESENQSLKKIYGSIQDITEQKRLSDTEQNYTNYLSTILDNLNDAVITIDESGRIMTVNQTVKAIFGYAPEDILGKDIAILMPEPFASNHLKYIGHYLETGDPKVIGMGRELTGKHANGDTFPIEVSISELTQNNQRQFVGIVKDITERKQAIDHIYKIAFFDDITNLPNHKSFEKDLRKLIIEAKAADKDIYCCMLDIDNFGQFNLSFGTETGDYILRVIAGRLKKMLTSTFTAYRGHADKFFVLHNSPFDHERDSETLEMLNSVEWGIHNHLSNEMILHGHSQAVSISQASAYVHGVDATYEKLVGILEFGRKRAKSQGHGGRVTLEKSEFNEYDRHNFISQSFQKALDNQEFFVVLQPQFDNQGAIISSEVLIRWHHPKIGMISPGEFIPIAEEGEAIIDIGYWVLNTACELLAAVRAERHDTTLSVNISGRHIVRPDFSDRLVAITDEWDIPPERLVLEITETTLVTSIDLVRQRIESLSALGFSFSIDDFGTGYSSLSYLKELPISELKIDRYFVDEINFESDEVPIVNTIIDMAHAMGVRTVAEGIENEIQMKYLTQKGCQIFQGFFLARPMSTDDWLSLIRRDKRHTPVISIHKH